MAEDPAAIEFESRVARVRKLRAGEAVPIRDHERLSTFVRIETV